MQNSDPSNPSSPAFSLIVGTVGRTEELTRLFRSLERQTLREFEVLLVDQNEDDRVEPLIRASGLVDRLVHLRAPRGLSRARNVGLARARGRIVAFPDDDCWYPEDTLRKAEEFFSKHPEHSGLTGRAMDEKLEPSSNRWAETSGEVTPLGVWRRAISITIFLRREVCSKIGGFDEKLGVGSGTPWGSGEETDYVLRALEAGFRVYFDHGFWVHHPQIRIEESPQALSRAYSYGCGMGRVLRSHRYPFWYFSYLCLRTGGGAAISALRLDLWQSRVRLQTLRGRVRGWLQR